MNFRILEMIATSGFLTGLECTKFVFGRGSTPDPLGPLGELNSAPADPLACLRGPTSKGRGMEGIAGKVKGVERTERGEKGRKVYTHHPSVPAYAPGK